MTIQVLNGANLGRLGLREPTKYGDDHLRRAGRADRDDRRASSGVDVQVRQTDDEGEMLRWIHAAADAGDAVRDQPRRLVAHLRRRCGTRSPG